jgi:NAD(P)-dependent dehydrogenase (short-subunit alcohol dehydrogenase family)
MIEQTVSTFGRLDAAFNNAATCRRRSRSTTPNQTT